MQKKRQYILIVLVFNSFYAKYTYSLFFVATLFALKMK